MNSIASTNKFHLIIQTNSPGELANWVHSIIKTYKQQCPTSKITLILTPCQYASGKEVEFAKEIPEITAVYSPKETIKHIFSLPIFIPTNERGAILFLGGDPLYSKLLGFKYKYPVFGYTEHKRKLGFYTFFKNEIGDLMADKIRFYHQNKSPIKKTYYPKEMHRLVFFGGSRPAHFNAFVPFISQVIKEINKLEDNYYSIIQISPFINDDHINQIKDKLPKEKTAVKKENSQDIMDAADLLITLPGTCTAEAMYHHLPMLVLFPLNEPKIIILDGIANYICKIPGIGLFIKKQILNYLIKKIKYAALPNQLKQEEVVPEMKGVLDPQEVAKKIIELTSTKDRLQQIRENLTKIQFPECVSEKIIKKILNKIKT